MEIKSLQQFNAALDFITEKHEAFMSDIAQATHVYYEFKEVPLAAFKDIADLYNFMEPSPYQGRLCLSIPRCKGTMMVRVQSVQVKACINYEEA